jgi:hypothetical protein
MMCHREPIVRQHCSRRVADIAIRVVICALTLAPLVARTARRGGEAVQVIIIKRRHLLPNLRQIIRDGFDISYIVVGVAKVLIRATLERVRLCSTLRA